MKKNLFGIYVVISIILTVNAISQSSIPDTTWLINNRQRTVSLGIIKYKMERQDTIPYFFPKGTGVIFYSSIDSNYKTAVLITAKHIFYYPQDKWFPESLQIRFSFFDNEPLDKYLGVKITLRDTTGCYWRAHPDTTVDLAAIPLTYDEIDLGGNIIKVMKYQDFARRDDYYEGATVFVLGYPGWIGDNFLNRTIFRQGTIAWVSPTNPDSNNFLIDCNVFHGNSGGPVFLMPTGIDRDGRMKHGGDIKFLGIVTQMRYEHQGIGTVFQELNMDTVLLLKKGQIDTLIFKRGMLESIYHMGIGVVEPASRVHTLLEKIGSMYKWRSK